MKSRFLQSGAERPYGAERSFVLVMDRGDEALDCLTRFAREQQLSAARFTGLGAFSEVVLGFFDWETKSYLRIPLREQVEVASLVGDVTLGPDGPQVHAHVVVSGRDGRALAGHLLEGRVRPTLEVMLIESPAQLRRQHDPESGLALIQP